MAKASKPAAKATAAPDQAVLTTLVAAHISGHGTPPSGKALDDLVATANKIQAIASGETEETEDDEK